MGHVIAFVPASGGVGATTLAAAVGVRAAAAGRSCVLVDLDRTAGRVDVAFGADQHPGWRWGDLVDVVGVVDGAALGLRLPMAEGVRLLSNDGPEGPEGPGGPVGSAGRGGPGGPGGLVGAPSAGPRLGEPRDRLEVAVDVVAGLAGAHDLTVLDLPRDPATLEALVGVVDALVVVVGTRLTQLAAAATCTPTLLRIVAAPPAEAAGRRSWSAPAPETWLVLRGGSVSDDLADVVVDHLDLPLLGVVRDEARLVADLEKGLVPGSRGRGSLVEVADDLLLRLIVAERAA